MYILGLNAFHGDSAACIIKDGNLIAAVEEERFRRIKHWAGFPSESIRFCLSEAGIELENIDYIAINQSKYANILKKIEYILLNRPNLKMIFDRFKNKIFRSNFNEFLKQTFPDSNFNGKFSYIEHHTAHLSSAFHSSSFNDSVVVSVDGFGDFASSAWGVGNATEIKIDGRVLFPHSLGIFYQALTQYIGFKNYGDEYKVMGLAPYGKSTYIDEVSKLVVLKPNGSFELNLNYFNHHKKKIAYQWNDGTPVFKDLYSKNLENLLGPSRNKSEPITQHHIDIAYATQFIYEKAFFHLLNKIHSKYSCENLCIAGGCGMNSVANGKISLNTPFKKVYVQAAAGDAGGAIGSAMSTWYKVGGKLSLSRAKPHFHAYWGPKFSNFYIESLIKEKKNELQEDKFLIEFFSDNKRLSKIIASEIADGKVVGWFQGRMEWGPRALGNRSIIGDPRRSDMKDILNLKIKRRESFRPFAPSVLKELVSEWFEQNDEVPFMMQVYKIKNEKQKNVPAVTHVDGTGRLQTVNKDTNPKYYNLIKEFYNLTNVPMVLNTSFNENEPIVCKPEEALNTFIRTKMDIIILEDWVIKRKK